MSELSNSDRFKSEDQKIKERQDDLELVSKIFIMWNMDKEPYDKEKVERVCKGMPIPEVIMQKMELVGLKLKLNQYFLMFLDICSRNSPGAAQVMLKDLLEDIACDKKLPRDYEINPNDIMLWKPDRFPLLRVYKDEEEYYHNKWLEQKLDDGTNKVDTYEYWLELFEEE